MKTSTIALIFRIQILLMICWGAQAWFTWGFSQSKISLYSVYFITSIIAYAYQTRLHIQLSKNINIYIAFLCFILGTLFYNRFSLPSLAGLFLTLYPILVVISDKKNAKKNIDFAFKGIAIILSIGLIEFFIINYVIKIPGIPINHSSSTTYVFLNYIFLLINVNTEFDTGSFRFTSIFLEPGYLATMVSFLLYAINYNFKKWEAKILLASIIVSFSLAGYIITFLGYTLFILSQGKSIKKILCFTILMVTIYFTAINYKNGDNYINNAIIERLQYDEEKGISGNNRTGAGTDFYYEKAVKDGTIFMGLGQEEVNKINGGSSNAGSYDVNIRGAGYKVFFVTSGILSAIMFLLFYIFISKGITCSLKYYRWSFIFLIIVTFTQAAYPTSLSWIYLFILGISYNKILQHKKE